MNYKVYLLLFLLFAMVFGNDSISIDVSKLRQVPVLENGRIKPLETYAASILVQFSNKSKFQKEKAIQWLARVMFTPQTALDDKIFYIANPRTVMALGINEEKKHRYSYLQILKAPNSIQKLANDASKIEDSKRDPADKELIRVFNKINTYYTLVESFSFALDRRDFHIDSDSIKTMLSLNKNEHMFTYLEIAQSIKTVVDLSDNIVKKEQSQWTTTEQQIIAILRMYIERSKSFVAFPGVHIIHSNVEGKEHWESPWSLLTRHKYLPQEKLDIIKKLASIAIAYQQNNQKEFDNATDHFLVETKKNIPYPQSKISMELFYNTLDPFYTSEYFYGFAFLLILLSYIFWGKWLYRISLSLMSIAVIINIIGITLRILITHKAPVTNLFETFIFVGAVSAILGLVVEKIHKNSIGIMGGSISALLLLLISNKYALDGDTMKVLVAVLNSNFWLSTHVITISLGYTGCCAAGTLGHIYIVKAMFKSTDPEQLRKIYKMIFGLLAFGFIFTFVGTVLGGIWADQSWGRFWGWDPKENGALLIVLWCGIIFHAKIDKIITEYGVAVLSVIGVIIVMLAWFGVNLLGVGLHSYGFTEGAAMRLYIYIAIEIVFIAVTMPRVLKVDVYK